MSRFVKHLFLAIALVASLFLTGCNKEGKQPRQRKEKFQVVSLDKVSGSMNEGWRLLITVANNTSLNMRITAANAFVSYNGRKIGRVALDGEVRIPRRSRSQVEVPLRLTLSNPIAALSIYNKVRKGDFSGIMVDYSISVSALASHRTIEQSGVSLEQMAQQFNLGLKK